MAWLIGIVCVILVIIFWRIFLPIAVVGIVAIVAIVLYSKIESDRAEEKRRRAEQETQQRIAKAHLEVQDRIRRAKVSGSDIERKWELTTQIDPASRKEVPRYASILSDDGLCRLQVEQRMNAVRLAGIYCPGLRIVTTDIEVKFDSRPTSDMVSIERFSDGSDVYIPSRSYLNTKLPYDQFLRRLTEGKKVAIRLTVEGAGDHWFAFSLLGSGVALEKIGAISSTITSPQKSTQARKSTPPQQSVGQQQTTSVQDKSKGNVKIGLPANATLNVYGNDWVCVRGYRRSGNECVAVQIPQNATLNVYGNDWQCQRGFRRVGNGCVAVQIPANATLNVYGNDWQCQRGFRRVGDGCTAVQIPENATLNVYGNDWQCVRGFRRSGSECVSVGVPLQ